MAKNPGEEQKEIPARGETTMKPFFTGLFIAVTLTSPVAAQNRTTREATYALLGPVRTVRQEVANVFKNDGPYVLGPRVLSMIVSFNEDGNRPELCLYDEKGSLTRRIEMRFEGKKQVEYLNYDGAGHMWLRGVNHYDAEGRPSGQTTYHGDGSVRSKMTLTRNDRGQVIESAEYDAGGSLLAKSRNTYSDAGEFKTFERLSYRVDGTLSSREFHNAPEKRGETVTYNRNGSVATTRQRIDQGITEYAADGSLKSTFITSAGRLPEESTYYPDGTVKKEAQIPDEIDAHGNWTKQTRWVTDAKGTRPVKVTYRVITYY